MYRKPPPNKSSDCVIKTDGGVGCAIGIDFNPQPPPNNKIISGGAAGDPAWTRLS
jgi:hypothetical protein